MINLYVAIRKYIVRNCLLLRKGSKCWSRLVIFNFSKYKLTKQEDTLLSKGLQFAIPPTEIEYAGNHYTETLNWKNVLVKILKFKKVNC